MSKKFIIPKRYIRLERTKGTVGTRAPDGTMTGRKTVDGYGDSTWTRRLIKSVDINKNGKIDDSEHGGLILGRSEPVRASRRAKGYERHL